MGKTSAFAPGLSLLGRDRVQNTKTGWYIPNTKENTLWTSM